MSTIWVFLLKETKSQILSEKACDVGEIIQKNLD